MSRLKTFAKYILWIILFWIFSDILIYAGINSTYKDMEQKGTIPDGVSIVQMQSTKVNGKINLTVNSNLSGKFLKVDLYSASDNLLGTQYIEIGTINETKSIETYFKISDAKSFEISVVDEMGVSSEGFMDTAMSAMSILILVLKLFFV